MKVFSIKQLILVFQGGVGNIPESEILGAEVELAFLSESLVFDMRLSWWILKLLLIIWHWIMFNRTPNALIAGLNLLVMKFRLLAPMKYKMQMVTSWLRLRT